MRLFFILVAAVLAVPAAGSSTGFVKVKDGRFVLNGKTWHPYGVMYTPLYAQPGPGKEPVDWIEAYNPDDIDKDLDLMKQIGFNTVRITTSTYYHADKQDENWATYPTPERSYKARLNDFLDRLGKRRMKAQLFIHYCPKDSRYIPLLFDSVSNPDRRSQSLDIIRKLITELGLANRPEILSYEVDWEPFVGGEAVRNGVRWKGYNLPLILWNRWIIDQYGSVENAEKCWGYIGSKEAGGHKDLVSAPTDEEVLKDGPWTRKTVAYRRFCEDLINKKYALITSAIHEVDPNHLVCAQRIMFEGKSPDHSKTIPYPVRHTAAFLDYFGYTFSPIDTWGLFDEEKYRSDDALFRKQGFGIRYSKFGKPVIFDEHGATVFYPNHPEQKEDYLEKIQKLHYERMHELGREFGIDGMLSWWWIGRRPMNKGDHEESDWGVLRPDHTPRPCVDVLKETAGRLGGLGSYKPDSLVTIDEYKHSDESDMYVEGKKLFLEQLEKGRTPDVTTPYWDTDSKTCSLVCLCGLRSHKHCPLRALNGVFGKVEALRADGRWTIVDYGSTLTGTTRRQLKLRLTVANTGDASWLDEKSAGGVYGSVAVRWRCGSTTGELPIASSMKPNDTAVMGLDLPAGLKAELVLRLSARGRTEFGDVVRIQLKNR